MFLLSLLLLFVCLLIFFLLIFFLAKLVKVSSFKFVYADLSWLRR